ncbi:nitrous oxide-stimulated promoter family protein [Anaerosinus massiliensis]|uniref:nitrous oxide-stimulated promoter family protein n=1 Tax=Massilibacillus massiliensis TaxID=1806837 RepID=UPI000A78770D|nr:nitrous oxide-stimulated promoter family protein [Massilibacillus massiliensis]
MNKIKLEQIAIQKMLRIYCKNKHGQKEGLCEACTALLAEVNKRLPNCRFGDKKPACGSCRINCYRGDKFKEITQIMRYAGPRMLLYHPILTIQHLIDVRFRNKR